MRVSVGSFMIAKPVAGAAVYSATKGAVKAFSQAAAKENADAGIRINNVNSGAFPLHCVRRLPLILACEGGIRTAMTEGLIAHAGAELPRDLVPQGRWGNPEEVANVIEFLLSSKASFVTVRSSPLLRPIGVR